MKNIADDYRAMIGGLRVEQITTVRALALRCGVSPSAVTSYQRLFLTFIAPSFTTWQGGLYEAELREASSGSGADHANEAETGCFRLLLSR